MLDGLFEGYVFKMLFAFIVVLGILALALWLVRRFGRERLTNAGGRGRQSRLAVIDAANVDGRRKLILIRRDNLEHLVMIGGPSDVLIEPNIARAGAAPREVAPPRRVPTGDTLQRPVPLGEGTIWPLQPEPGPRQPLPRPEPQPVRSPSPATEPSAHWPPREPELPQSSRAAPPRDLRERTDPLSRLSEELERAATASEPEGPEPPVWLTTRREPRLRPAPSVVTPPAPAKPTDAKLGPSADQDNDTNVAQRLEAVLRRPNRDEETSGPAAAPKMEKPESEGEEMGQSTSSQDSSPALRASPSLDTVKSPREETRPDPNEGRPAPQKSIYDSLEQEMASLLGGSGSKN
jgi:flagellar protein FliO/FliZ